MNRIIRYWNQNRKNIIITVAIVAFIIIIIRIINSMYAKVNTSIASNNVKDDEYQPTKSVITGESVSYEITSGNKNEIDNFVNYCNNKEYEKAYEFLTEDCKEEYSNSVEQFKQQYASKIFSKIKTYDIELWLKNGNDYTYRVTYYDDNLLETGGKNINNNIQDYITVVNRNNEKKININSFIEKKTLTKSKSESNIEIIVNSKKIYKNYEEYSFIIRNKTDKIIRLTDEKNGKNICVRDENNVEYSSLLTDISTNELELKPGFEKNINIKFNKIYDTGKNVKEICFKGIIKDYERYMQNENMEKVEVEIDVR